MKHFLTLLLLLSAAGLAAQFGVHGYYQTQQTPDWNATLTTVLSGKQNVDFLERGYRFGVDYWSKPIEDLRITVTPGISVARSTSELTNEAALQPAPVDFSLLQIGLNLPINVYPFDLYGDCDCPTWSQSEPFLKKGFFFQVMPAVYHNTYRARFVGAGEAAGASNQNVNFALGAGAGLDIGFSDLITLSPTVRYVQHFGKQWTNLPFLLAQNEPATQEFRSDLRAWEFGMRLGIRLDY